MFYYSDLSFFHLEIQYRLLMHVTAGDGEATSDIIHFLVVLTFSDASESCRLYIPFAYLTRIICLFFSQFHVFLMYQGYPFGFLFNNLIQTFDVCYSRAQEIERLSSQFLNASCQIRPPGFAVQ